jgi:hypothetical protein
MRCWRETEGPTIDRALKYDPSGPGALLTLVAVCLIERVPPAIGTLAAAVLVGTMVLAKARRRTPVRVRIAVRR